MLELTDSEFEYICKYVRSKYGINLSKKRYLIQTRLQSTLTERGLKNFTDYFAILRDNKNDEITNFLNHITTNHTFFLREKEHFDLLDSTILPQITKNGANKNINIWSAGCSSGEEAYSTVMTIYKHLGFQFPSWTQKIYATDISYNAMNKAKKGQYTLDALQNLPKEWIRTFFTQVNATDKYMLKDIITNRVDFNYFNLMSTFPFSNKFDIIFCRNVMIYFDNEVKQVLVKKFYDALKPNGYLLIGHSETLNSIQGNFVYIKPSVYRKEEVI